MTAEVDSYVIRLVDAVAELRAESRSSRDEMRTFRDEMKALIQSLVDDHKALAARVKILEDKAIQIEAKNSAVNKMTTPFISILTSVGAAVGAVLAKEKLGF